MKVTEVRIKLMEGTPGNHERLLAFCSITLDDMFVIRDLKIIEGGNGLFVAMPSRKLTDNCGHCGTKNPLTNRYCGHCGAGQQSQRAWLDASGRIKLHADIAHPINHAGRGMVEDAVLEAYHLEREWAKQPGYTSRYDDADCPNLAPIRRRAVGA